MDDGYIRKQDALKGQKTGTFANGICFEVKACVPVKYIKSLKPADVVPVVRCKDCKHVRKWRSEKSAKKFGQVYECARGIFTCPDPDDFCSYGKRR